MLEFESEKLYIELKHLYIEESVCKELNGRLKVTYISNMRNMNIATR